ncbi:MAG: hypothetical protein PGN21_15690 [Sphingomonas paucimobilis]
MLLLLPLLLLVAAIIGSFVEARRSPYAFAMGRVISNTFSAIGGAPLALFGASALLSVPMQLVMLFRAPAVYDADRLVATGSSASPLSLLILLLYPMVSLFMAGIAVDTLAGRPVDPGATLRMALRRALPAIAMFLLFGIALFVGFALLVVPAVALLVTWFVVVPVMAAEGRGPLECFGRSSQLMRGTRWRLLLLLVIVALLWLVAGLLVQGPVFLLVGASDGWTGAVVRAVFGTLTGVLPATGTAAVYHEVRTAKEGAGDRDLASVFA